MWLLVVVVEQREPVEQPQQQAQQAPMATWIMADLVVVGVVELSRLTQLVVPVVREAPMVEVEVVAV